MNRKITREQSKNRKSALSDHSSAAEFFEHVRGLEHLHNIEPDRVGSPLKRKRAENLSDGKIDLEQQYIKVLDKR